MPKPYPKEFRDDVVAVARSRPKGTTLKQIADDFGISDSCLANWLAVADADEGRRAGPTSEEISELRAAQRRIRLLEQEKRGPPPRCGLSVPRKPAPKMMYPLVRELADDGIPVTVTCRVLKLVRQDYYRWLAAPLTARELEEAYLANALFDAHHDDPEFGYRFLADEVHDNGFEACERTVWKVCSRNGWWSSFGKKKTRKKTAKVHTPAYDDLVRRQFSADAPNHLWLGDITEHQTREGKLYVCAIKDVFSNRIVGYSIDERMKARLAVAALNNAVARRGDVAGCVFHTDRGSQFRSRKVHRALARHRMVGSMGQVGSAGDNAAMESFFALLQKNVLNTKRWETREELRIAIVTWIERTYHRRRRQDALGRLTPIEYETIMTTPNTQAA